MNTIYTAETFTQKIPHSHRGIELVYVADGNIGMDFYPPNSGEKKKASYINITSGQFFLINSFVPHLQYVYEKSHMMILELDTYNKTLYPKDMLRTSQFALSCNPILNLCKSLDDILLFRDNRNVFSVFSEVLYLLYNEYHNLSTEYFETDLELALKRLMVEICKCQQLTHIGKKHNAYVFKALAFLDNHYSESNTVEQVENLLGISVHQLNTYLKSELNQSFNGLLTEKRMESAKNFLKSTNRPIGSIASETGYANLRNFEAAFKKKYGITPKEFRQNSEEEGFVFWTDSNDLSFVGEDFRIQLKDGE